MLAAVPDALDVDGLCEVPDLFLGVEGVVVSRVHDTSVVELLQDDQPSLPSWNSRLHAR